MSYERKVEPEHLRVWPSIERDWREVADCLALPGTVECDYPACSCPRYLDKP